MQPTTTAAGGSAASSGRLRCCDRAPRNGRDRLSATARWRPRPSGVGYDLAPSGNSVNAA